MIFCRGPVERVFRDLPNSYDSVVCEQVPDLPQIDVALGTLARILKPGGKLAVRVPVLDFTELNRNQNCDY